MQVIECVPNFSVGEDTETLNAIVSAIEKSGKSKVVHIHSHKGAERSVLSIFSSPEDIVTSIFAGISKAVELIDMRNYRGVHPAIGACDICPFIPLKNVSVETCQKLSTELANKLAAELNLPSYQYGICEKNSNFIFPAPFRKNGFLGLKTSELPFFAGSSVHPRAGAVLIGVRNIMLAYNISLDSKDIELAKKIAREIRTTGYIKNGKRVSGELKACQAIGWHIEDFDCIQVSCNLHDYKKTGLYETYEAVKKRAGNVEILGSEIIGLVPEAALFKNTNHSSIEDAIHALKLYTYNFTPETKIIEHQLRLWQHAG